jgi:Putative transposase/Transposase zinc-binding domain
MAKLTLQQIFQQGSAAFALGHRLPGYVRKAAWALMVCRTAALGGHVQRCPDGHFERIWYNSCRHRLCPHCSWLQIERWLATQKARLLACDHDHAIFTIPDELRGLWLANVKPMTDLLFTAVRETLFELLGDATYLGARPGLIATRHTWSQTLVLHPHLHCLVTGGGVTDEGEWRMVRNGFLLPVRVVMALFRGKLLAALDTAVYEGTLTLPDEMTLRHWATLRNRLGRAKWNVHIRERYPHGVGVLTSVARDLRGGPIANQRLVACDQGVVTFRYRRNGEGAGEEPPSQGCMHVSIEEFIRRYLLHVPAPGTRVVRAYGLYAATKREALAGCRAQLGQGPTAEPVVLDWQTACRDRGDAHPERCPRCGRLLVRLGVILPARSPPPARGLMQVVACTAGHAWALAGRRRALR